MSWVSGAPAPLARCGWRVEVPVAAHVDVNFGVDGVGGVLGVDRRLEAAQPVLVDVVVVDVPGGFKAASSGCGVVDGGVVVQVVGRLQVQLGRVGREREGAVPADVPALPWVGQLRVGKTCVERFGVGEHPDPPDQRGRELTWSQSALDLVDLPRPAAEQFVGGVQNLLGRPTVSGGVQDGGDQRRPGRVGQHPAAGVQADQDDQAGQDRGPAVHLLPGHLCRVSSTTRPDSPGRDAAVPGEESTVWARRRRATRAAPLRRLPLPGPHRARPRDC